MALALALVHERVNAFHVQERQVTAVELQKAMHTKKLKHVHGHASILSSCYRKIKRVADVDETSCLFEVPEFVMGVPPFDLSRAVSHVMSNLESNGFTVAYMFPRALLISWDTTRSDEGVTHMRDRVSPIMPDMDRNASRVPTSPLFERPDKSHHVQANVGYRSITDFKPKGRFVLKL